MSSKTNKPPAQIPLPPTTRQRVEALINQRQTIGLQIEAIILTARDTMDVPEEYVLRNTGIGFEPLAPEPPA